jgi:hypothetical protein
MTWSSVSRPIVAPHTGRRALLDGELSTLALESVDLDADDGAPAE